VAVAAPSVETVILKNAELFKNPSDWSPDGQYIVYALDSAKTGADVFFVPVEGDQTPRPYVQTPANESAGVVSPDGRWLAYQSDESGANEVYVQSFPTPGVRHRVGPGEVPVWNHAGTMLSWLDADHVKLWVADVRLSPEFQASTPRSLGVVPPNNLSWFLRSDFTRVLATVPTGNTGGPSVTVITNWLAALGKK
jgi:serine/threonine-protein kinase